MSAQRKTAGNTSTRRPARPRDGALDIKGHHAAMSKRFPKIMAKLAE